MSYLITFNAGSSSVKFAVYQQANEPIEHIKGQVENLGTDARLIISSAPKESLDIGAADHAAALAAIIKTITPRLDNNAVIGIGHRIVHGGTTFTAPIVLDADTLQQLDTLTPLAPLHQPHNLSMVRASMQHFPDAVQVGCFDTAFHHHQPWVNKTFAIPRRFYAEGVQRYGFHGLSYQYISDTLFEQWPELARGRVVVAHLGNGASMCAIRNGQSITSSMGFSAMEGLPMGTRPGQLDPGVILYWLDQGMSCEAITHLLYKECGLKGLSGISHDMRTLLTSEAPEAKQAIDYFIARIQRELGAMTAVLGGLDALVFCGGVGENAPEIRAGVLDGMGYLGLAIDQQANQTHAVTISSGKTPVLVIPTDEELVIARSVTERL